METYDLTNIVVKYMGHKDEKDVEPIIQEKSLYVSAQHEIMCDQETHEGFTEEVITNEQDSKRSAWGKSMFQAEGRLEAKQTGWVCEIEWN